METPNNKILTNSSSLCKMLDIYPQSFNIMKVKLLNFDLVKDTKFSHFSFVFPLQPFHFFHTLPATPAVTQNSSNLKLSECSKRAPFLLLQFSSSWAPCSSTGGCHDECQFWFRMSFFLLLLLFPRNLKMGASRNADRELHPTKQLRIFTFLCPCKLKNLSPEFC